MPKRESSAGFTIVELLIVVVIIAILAAITLVTYNGVQQRASNAAIVDAASKAYRMIQAYVSANGSYPSTLNGSQICITTTSGCLNYNGDTYGGNATFETNIATIGSLPRTIPKSGLTHNGVVYSYSATRVMNGTVQPVIVYYWLFGTAQQCGLPVTSDYFSPMSSSTTGYTIANDSGTSGKTLCVISISGPTA